MVLSRKFVAFLCEHARVFALNVVYICNIGPTCCVLKKAVSRKKKYSNSKVREENIVVVYNSLRATIVATRKVGLVTFFFSLPLGGDGGCR